MKRVLLIGRDPVFAWALQKKIMQMHYHVEHVYTLTEAKIRLTRFQYPLVLLDGLAKLEISSLLETIDSHSTVFLFDTIDSDLEGIDTSDVFQVSKESALECVLASLGNHSNGIASVRR